MWFCFFGISLCAKWKAIVQTTNSHYFYRPTYINVICLFLRLFFYLLGGRSMFVLAECLHDVGWIEWLNLLRGSLYHGCVLSWVVAENWVRSVTVRTQHTTRKTSTQSQTYHTSRRWAALEIKSFTSLAEWGWLAFAPVVFRRTAVFGKYSKHTRRKALNFMKSNIVSWLAKDLLVPFT